MITLDSKPAANDLAAAIQQNTGADETVRFWWLGQAGFALRYRDQLILIDPYLSDTLAEKYRNSELPHRRMQPVPVAPTALDGCTWYLCTHAHTDHMDPGTIGGVLQVTSPSFVLPRAEIARAHERGIPTASMFTLNDGEMLQLADGVRIQAVAAAHERLEIDPQGNHKFLGYVLTLGTVRLYHSGDCVPYPGLARKLAPLQIDVALLPINGRDSYRLSKGIPGNFTLVEAVDLCRAAHIRHLVGHHFEMFDFNTIDRAQARTWLQQNAGSLTWLLPEIGATYDIRPGTPG